MRRRTVLHVAQPTTAGVARVVADLTADQLARGWDVTVACPTDGTLAANVVAAGARHLAWPAGRTPGPSVPAEAVRLRAGIQRVRPDVVHLHSSKAGLVGRLLLHGRLPTLFQPHAWSFLAVSGAARQLTVRWERLAAGWADRLLVVSEQERADGEAAGVRGRYVHVPNGVDLTAWIPADRPSARRALGLADGPLAVCVGRLSAQKGQDVLLQAWDDVRADVPGALLVLVGDGPDRTALEARAGDDVLFTGARSDVRTWLTAADVVVLPSRWEGLSLVALEALAVGRSLVASDVAGVREQVGEDAGAVVPTQDPAALAAALTARLRDRVTADREGAAGRRRVERSFDLSRTAGRVAEVYHDVLAERRRRP